jgi:hypothetical protein
LPANSAPVLCFLFRRDDLPFCMPVKKAQTHAERGRWDAQSP